MTDERSHDEIAELLGAYALDAVSPDEAAEIEQHIATCQSCASEVAGHREVAASLAHSFEEPPSALWTRIAEEISRPELPSSLRRRANETASPSTQSGEAPRRSSRLAVVLAAAAVIAIAVLGAVIVRQGDRIDRFEQVAEPTVRDLAESALSDPDSEAIDLVGGDGTRAVVVVEPEGRGYLFADALPALSADRSYQLWGVTGDRAVSLGVLGPTPDVVAFAMPEGVEALAVTNEAAGGVIQSDRAAVVAGTIPPS